MIIPVTVRRFIHRQKKERSLINEQVMRVKDQLGNEVEFDFPPARIVSLVPSQSELLWDLGLSSELVGITKFCIHPEKMFRNTIRIGGTKKISIKKIEALKPDLIIGNKEENQKEQIEELQKKFPVWISDIYCLDDALSMMKKVGAICNRATAAERIISQIKNISEEFNLKNFSLPHCSVAYFIWKKPYMVAGRNTFINDLLKRCGLKNVFANIRWTAKDFANNNIRYPEITEEQLRKEKPDLIFLSSEPYPFNEKHLSEFRKICPDARIIIVDGEMFSWYGTRLVKAFDYLKKLKNEINPSAL